MVGMLRAESPERGSRMTRGRSPLPWFDSTRGAGLFSKRLGALEMELSRCTPSREFSREWEV